MEACLVQDTLARYMRQRVLTAWHDVYIHMVMKRFQMARAQGLFREHVEQHMLGLWRRHVKTQRHKAAMLSAAQDFNRCSKCTCRSPCLVSAPAVHTGVLLGHTSYICSSPMTS